MTISEKVSSKLTSYHKSHLVSEKIFNDTEANYVFEVKHDGVTYKVSLLASINVATGYYDEVEFQVTDKTGKFGYIPLRIINFISGLSDLLTKTKD